MANIEGFGSELYRAISYYSEKDNRVKAWNNLLIDNEKGIIVNNEGALHYDDHKRMLDDVIEARKYLPTGLRLLMGIGGIGVNVSLYQTLIGYTNMNEFNAKVSMNVSNRQSQQTDYQWSWIPQPIYHSDFHVPWRQHGGFSYKQSDGSQEATMQVELLRDKVLFMGEPSIQVNVNGQNFGIPGLTNHPNTLQLPGGISDWANSANTDNVYKEAINLVKRLFTDRKAAQIPNSVVMFVANDVWPMMEQDYASQKGDRTIKERIMAISAIKTIEPSQWLPDGAVMMVEATPQTLRIAQSMDTRPIPWQRDHEFKDMRFTIAAAGVLQVRSDRNGLTGLLYATK